MSETMADIRVKWNTIPDVYEKRAEAEKGVRDGIGDRPGVWSVTLDEPQNASLWAIGIESPDARHWRFDFDGPEQQTCTFVKDAIVKALPASTPRHK